MDEPPFARTPSSETDPPETAPVTERMSGPVGVLQPKERVLLVTGMSGAGRSSSLRMLEDLGYEAVDNLPLSLLPRLLRREGAPPRPVAVGIDVRTRDFNPEAVFREALRLGEEEEYEVRLVFLDCEDELLGRRYTETRRRHPLAGDRPIMDGIRLERRRLSELRDLADLVIDTTSMKPGDLKLLLQGHFALGEEGRLALFVTSFSFRQGLPREADLVFDVRFLDNPHYHAELRPLTGRDSAVGRHITADPAFPPFIEGLKSLLMPLLPRYAREGKSYLTIAIGCTGGRHRSVFTAELLADWLAQQGQAVTLSHRDLPARTQEMANRAGDPGGERGQEAPRPDPMHVGAANRQKSSGSQGGELGEHSKLCEFGPSATVPAVSVPDGLPG